MPEEMHRGRCVPQFGSGVWVLRCDDFESSTTHSGYKWGYGHSVVDSLRKRAIASHRAMEARVAGVPEDEESGLLPRASARRPSSSSAVPRLRPPPAVWATVDGPLGLPLEEAEGHARRFFLWGFACLPFLWAINCCYFWPVLRSPAASSPAAIRPYVVRSAIGFSIFSLVLITWATTFIVGGERLFGPTWNDLLMYNVADKLGISGFMG